MLAKLFGFSQGKDSRICGNIGLVSLEAEFAILYVFLLMKQYEETEMRFEIKDVASILEKIKACKSQFLGFYFIRDIIFGSAKNKNKIRLRLKDDFHKRRVVVESKQPAGKDKKYKVEVEELVYQGTSVDEAIMAIKQRGDFVEENSYEKVRVSFSLNHCTVDLDFYPYGAWLEIEGGRIYIEETARLLDLSIESSTKKNADECYLDWQKKHSLPELWRVRFGLHEDFEKPRKK